MKESLKILSACLIVILLFTALTEFAQKNRTIGITPQFQGVDKKLQPYIDEFNKLSRGTVVPSDYVDFTAGIGYMNGNILGYCVVSPFYREVVVNKIWWESPETTELERKELMFHELGHCILFRPHSDYSTLGSMSNWIQDLLYNLGIIDKKPYLKDGCPVSIMYPYSFSQTCVKEHYDYYISELFGFENSEYETVVEEIEVD